jgi:hypothetical protein
MSSQRKTNGKQFWFVVLGLFLFIGLITGVTYLLDAQGWISTGGEMQDGPRANLSTGVESGEMRTRPEREEQAGGFNGQALMGLAEVLIKMSVVVLIVTGGQGLLSWVQRRRRRMPVALG